MEVNDVMALPWRGVTETELSLILQTAGKQFDLVSKRDVEVWAESIFREAARKLGISYVNLYPILKQENHAFFIALRNLFRHCPGLSKDNDTFRTLMKYLKIPCRYQDDLDKYLKLFEELSDMEKLIFLKIVGKVQVSVTVTSDE